MPAPILARLNALPKPFTFQGWHRLLVRIVVARFGMLARDASQRVVGRDDDLPTMPALASGHNDRVIADVRPGNAQQVSETQPRMSCKVNGVGDLCRAQEVILTWAKSGRLELGDAASVQMIS